MKVTVSAPNRTHEFEALPGATCLHSGLASSIDLPYECATGTCGTCRVKLMRGSVRNRWAEAPGLANRTSEDDLLLCQCEPLDDCAFTVDSHVYTVPRGPAPVSAQSGMVTGVKYLNATIATLSVTLAKPMNFLAGQFVTLECQHAEGGRAYSMTNYGVDVDTLKFLIKRKPGGLFTEGLFDSALVSRGDAVRIVGPFGKATFQPSIRKNLLMAAGGSGVAGMLSILECCRLEGYFEQFRGTLFFGVRTEADLFLLDELSSHVEESGGKLSVIVALSDEEPTENLRARYSQLRFEYGVVHEVMSRGIGGKLVNVCAYLAGPPPAVDAAKKILLVQGKLSPADIRFDKFS